MELAGRALDECARKADRMGVTRTGPTVGGSPTGGGDDAEAQASCGLECAADCSAVVSGEAPTAVPLEAG